MGTYKSKYSGVEIDQILNNAQSDHMDVADNKSQISGLNQALTDIKKDLQHQINTLVLESGGDSNLEVVNARADTDSHMHGTLNDRLESDFNKKADKSTVVSLQSQVSTNTTKTVDLQSQIDSLVIGAGGDSNPEVVQARTDENGTTHETLKARIDSSVTDLKSDLNKKVTTTPNLFNKDSSDNISGYFSETTITENNKYCLSHIIKVKTGVTYKWKKTVEIGVNNRIPRYDDNGNYLGWNSAVTDVDDETYWNYTPIEDRNIRINMGYVENIGDAMICVKNDYPQNYAPYGNYVNDDINIKDICIGSDGTVYQTAGTAVRSQIDDINAKLVKTVNLFDYKNSSNKLGYSVKGTFTSDDKYCLSHLIPVKLGITYKWLKPTELGTNNSLEAYTESGSYFDYKMATVDGDYLTYTASFNGFIKVNVGHLTNSFNFMVCEESKYPSKYIPYGNYVNDEVNGNPLCGKKAVFTGDSICAGAGDAGGYSKYIANKNNMSIQNIAVSGGTIVETSGHWNIGESISSLDADADYVILEGGVNDASLSTPLGTITVSYWRDFDKTTFCGAFESMIKDTLERFPSQKKGYILVHKCTANFASDIGNGSDGDHYTAVLKICKKWGIPVLNLQEHVPPFAFLSSEYPQLRAIRDKYTYNGDGWHPNALGYMTYYVDVIEEWMKTL